MSKRGIVGDTLDAKKPCHSLLYNNIMGRDALARTLGLFPPEEAMREVTARLLLKDDDLVYAGVMTATCAAMTLLRQLDWLAYCPSTHPAENSPDAEYPVQQLRMEDRLTLLMLTGEIVCEVSLGEGGAITPNMNHEKTKRSVWKWNDPAGVFFQHGDDRTAPQLRSRIESRLASIRAFSRWKVRVEPDPDDLPRAEHDVLPIAFFEIDEDVRHITTLIDDCVHDIFAEAGVDRPHDAYRLDDYRRWFAALVLTATEYEGEHIALLLALFRAIGVELGVHIAMRLVADVFCGLHDLGYMNARRRRILTNLYGQTVFPTEYFNLEDLHPKTLDLSGLPNNGIEWCY